MTRLAPVLALLTALRLVSASLPLALGQEEPALTKAWEYKAVSVGSDEKAATKKLNDLAAEGWELVGPLGNGLVAFRRGVSSPVSSNGSSAEEVAANKELYGNPIQGDSLNNIPLGGQWGTEVSFRFRAEQGGEVANFRYYNMFSKSSPGYNSGTGGKPLIQIRPDDGTDSHAPSMEVLGSGSVAKPYEATLFPLVTFDKQIKLKKDQLYHIVFKNIDPDPAKNYVSIDCLWTYPPATNPQQPAVSDRDLCVLWRTTGNPNWRGMDEGNYTPIFSLYLKDGNAYGMGLMESSVEDQKSIAGGDMLRQKFTVSGNSKNVVSVSVRLGRKGSHSGALTIRLEKGNGELIEDGTVAAEQVKQLRVEPGFKREVGHDWVTYTFAQPRTLAAGETYHLVLRAPAGDPYRIFPLRDGSGSYGFKSPWLWTQGWAEYSTSGGEIWTGYSLWGKESKEQDLQLYFTLAR